MAPSTTDKMVEAAIWLLVQGDKAGAEHLLTQALRQDPTHERARQAMRSLGAPTSPGARPPTAPGAAQTVPLVPALVPPESSRTPVDPHPALPRPPPYSEAPSTHRYGFDPGGLAAVREAVKARKDGAGMRTTDLEDLIGGALRRDAPPVAETAFDPRPEDSTLPGKRMDPDAPEARPGGRESPPASPGTGASTALDLSLERALNELPPPTSADHPDIEHASRVLDGSTDRHLSLVRGEPGTSGTHPELMPVHRDPPPALGEAPAGPSAATAVMPREWTVSVLTGPHAGRVLQVGRRAVMLGRGLGALQMDDDPFLSPAHASFFLRGGELFVADGSSTSGTWHSVDGVFRLSPGDSFSAGQQRLRFLGPLGAAPQVRPIEYGAPVPGASWRLEQTLVGRRPGRAWVLRGIVGLGRGKHALSFPDDEGLAPHHADLRPAGPELELVDRSQGLGTWVCLPSGGERRLPPRTLVRVGTTVVQVLPP